MPGTPEQILDELLVLHAQDGDRPALETLLRRCSGRLHQRARALCGDEDGAGEVLQRSLIAIAKGLHALDDPRAFGGWCARIVAHKASDWIRARRRERGREASPPGLVPPEPHGPGRGGDGEAALGQTAEHRQLLRALDAMSPERRALLVLHYGRGIPLSGLSAALGVPVGTVKSRLFKARREIARAFERESHEPE